MRMIAAEGKCRPVDRCCLRFKCSSVYELKAVDKLPVHELSAVNDRGPQFKYSPTTIARISLVVEILTFILPSMVPEWGPRAGPGNIKARAADLT